MFAASKTDSVSGGPPDGQFNYVTMLLHGDGTNGAQNNTFLDSSTNNFTITRNGNTTQGSFSPYGSNWGNFFLNTSNNNRITWDFTSSPAQTALAGTNSTIEFWVFRLPKSGTYQCMFSTAGDRNNFILLDSTTLQVTSNGGTEMFLINPDTYIPLNTWTHVALTCSGTTWTLYFNGTSYGTYSGASKSNNSGSAQLGGRNDMNGCGYLSNFRISTISRYSGNFTPSTTPFVSDGSTAMLTCQSNRFVDNSANAQALSVNGTMSVQRFNPFGASTTYSTSVIGGSGYFDGNGDFLTGPTTNSAFDFGSGNWTIDTWAYPTAFVSQMAVLISLDNATGESYAIGLLINANGSVQVYQHGGSYFINSTSSTGVIKLNTWSHIAAVRSGSNFAIFVNGTRVASVSGVSGTQSANRTVNIGQDPYASNLRYTGYLSDLRVVKGTAVYDPTQTTITVPTAPLTAITNTQLLTNFTNGAIFDNAMMNDLETVGNAQISTSVKKFGTGSLAFDGTGDCLKSNPASTDLYAFGSGNFTIEMWFYITAFTNTYSTLFDSRPVSTQGAYPTIAITSGRLYYYVSSAERIATANSTITTGQWYHLAVSRSGTSTKMFLDGTQVGSTYTDSTVYVNGTSRPVIGAEGFNSPPNDVINGYIDDLRITKGYARYTANFTPPTSALSDTGPY